MLCRGSLVVDICLEEEKREEKRRGERDDGDRNALRFLPRPEERRVGRAKKRSRVVLGSA